MLNAIKVLLCTGFLGCCATAVSAATLERVFTQAEQVGQRSEHAVLYLLPLGRVKEDRQAGRVQPSQFERLQGNLTSVTWLVDSALSLQDARKQVAAFLAQHNPELLFQCESRDCGESFAWANAIFNQPILFGSDRNQFLWVIRSRDTERYQVLYLIERPNRRIYFHEETLLVPPGMLSATAASQTLVRSGSVTVGAVPFLQGKPDFGPLVTRVAHWQPDISLPPVLVLHRHGAHAADASLSAQLAAELDRQGIKARVEDVGALAPSTAAPGPVWVEWVDTEWTPGPK